MGATLESIRHSGTLVIPADNTATHAFEIFPAQAFDDDWGIVQVHIDSTVNLDDVTLTFIRTSLRELSGVSRANAETGSGAERFELTAGNSYTADIVGTRWQIRTTAAGAVEFVYRIAAATHPEITHTIESALVLLEYVDPTAAEVSVDDTNFGHVLALEDVANVQEALEAIDTFPVATALRVIYQGPFVISPHQSQTNNTTLHFAANNDIASIEFVLSVADATGIDETAVVSYYNSSNTHLGDFFVSSVTEAPAGADLANPTGTRVTFTGFVHRDYQDALDPFAVGSAGDGIRVFFSASHPVTVAIEPKVGNGDTYLGYDSSGVFGLRPPPSGGGLSVDATGFDGNLDTSDDTVQEVAQAFDDYVPDVDAADVSVDASGFDGNLDSTVDTVQEVAQALDDLDVPVTAGDVSVVATDFDGNLDTDDDTVQEVAQKFDDYLPDGFRQFVYGEAYAKNDMRRYQDVLYRALADIDAANEIPPLDPTNWGEMSSHGIEGYGEVADNLVATIDFSSEVYTGVTLTAASDEIYETLDISVHDDLPQGLVFINGNDDLKSRVDGLVLTFPQSANYDLKLTSNVTSNTTVNVKLQARIREGGSGSDTGEWTTVKSAVQALANTGQNVVNTIQVSSNADVSFTLDDDWELRFRWAFSLDAGSATIVIFEHFNNDDLTMHVSGVRETRHLIAHGTGSNSGSIVAINSSDDTETELIDIDNGAEYVGPTKLSGLASDLTATEQGSIKDKLNIVLDRPLIYWPDRSGTIVSGTVAINAGGRVFVARNDIATTDANYNTDPDTNTAGARAAWEATHLQNTHGYIDDNEFIIVFGERNNLQALEIELGISLDVAQSFSRLMLIFKEGRIFFATPEADTLSDYETDRIQPHDADTYDNVQDFIVITGNHTDGYGFRIGDDLVRYESLKSGLQDLIDGKASTTDLENNLGRVHGRRYELTYRSAFNAEGQIRIGAATISITQLLSNPDTDFRDFAGTEEVFELYEDGDRGNYQRIRLGSATEALGFGFRQVQIPFTVLASDGTLSFSDGDTVIFQTGLTALTAIPDVDAGDVPVDDDGFEHVLALADSNTVQNALEAVDAFPTATALNVIHQGLFEITDGESDTNNTFEAFAANNDIASLTFTFESGLDDVAVISIYNSVEHTHLGDFFVSDHSSEVIGTPLDQTGVRITFNGFVYRDFRDLVNPFAAGSVGDNVRVHFSTAHAATVAVEPQGPPETYIGYGSDRVFGTHSLPAVLPYTVLPRLRGLWFDFERQTTNVEEGDARQSIIVDIANTYGALFLYQNATDPAVDYRDYFAVGDLYEVVFGSDYQVFQVTSINESTINNGTLRNIQVFGRIIRDVDLDIDNGDTFRIVTDRHGILRIPVYRENISIAEGKRLYRLDLERSWSDFDYLEINPHEQSQSRNGTSTLGFDSRMVPVPLLETLGIVTADNVDVRESGLLHMSFRAIQGANNDGDWYITRATLTDVPSDEAIAYATDSSGDDPQPLEINYILQR